MKLDFTNIAFYFENELKYDINDIVMVIDDILKNKKNKEENMCFDEWFLNNFDKEKLYIPKGIIRAITFSDSSKTLVDYGIYILETFFEDCYTLEGGLEKLINSLSGGVDIKRSTVQKLLFKNNKLIATTTNEETIDTDKDLVILTAPPGDIEIQNHEELLKIFSKIKYSGCAVIIFKVDKGFPEKPDYIFFPEKKYKISVIEQIKINDDEFIGCLIPYDSIIDKDKIISYSTDFLGEFFNCNFNGKIMDTYYKNWDKGIPIVDENYVKAVNKLNSMNFDNLLFAGDYTTLLPSMESAVKSGMETAMKIEKFKS